MKTIFPNIWMLVLRIVFIAFFIYMFQWPLEKIQTGEFQHNPTMFFVGFIVFSMFPGYLLWTLFGVLWVTFSEDNTKIRFHHFYKTVEVTGSDIEGYFRTVQNSKVSKYNGLLIKLKTNTVVEVTEYNLKTFKDINDFLKANRVSFKGDKNSWFPLKRRI